MVFWMSTNSKLMCVLMKELESGNERERERERERRQREREKVERERERERERDWRQEYGKTERVGQ